MLELKEAVRQQHDLEQGTPEWHAFRLNHIGASEIAAVLGLSKYQSRTDILKAKSTGIAPEVDARTQQIFDRGHEVEAMARPIAEKIIGEALYSTVWSYGQLSASCDGLNSSDTIGWEHKQFNKALFEQVSRGELPDTHMPQVQQCLLVTGAEKWLFMVSDGTEEVCAHLWVYPDQTWFDKIEPAAAQVFVDIKTFKAEPEYIPAVAAPIAGLPAIWCEVSGNLTIDSDLSTWMNKAVEFVESINDKPESDQDFVDLDAAGKEVKRVRQEELPAVKHKLQSASFDLKQAFDMIDKIDDYLQKTQSRFEKIVKVEKDNRKTTIVSEAKEAFGEHYRKIQSELPIVFNFCMPNFADAIKGKKSLSSMQEAVSTMLANAKIEADALAHSLREKHTWYIENAYYSFLFSDLQEIIYKDKDSFQAIVANRISQHQEQERIKAEADAKAQEEREERIRREAEEKAQREAAAREKQIAEDAARAERERIAAEQQEKDDAIRNTKREAVNTEAGTSQNYADVSTLEAHTSNQDATNAMEQLGQDDLQAEQKELLPESTATEEKASDFEVVGPAPARIDLIEAISNEWNVSRFVAEQWLISEFSR